VTPLDKSCYMARNLHDKQQYKIAAVITDRQGNVLSVGTNSYKKTHTLQAYYAAMAGEPKRLFRHAEIHAISRLPRGSKPWAIYISRMNRNGEFSIAKPCPICAFAIKDTSIKNVYFTIGNPSE